MTATRLSSRALGVVVSCVAAWGGLVAFVGPTFDFDVRGTGAAWVWDQGHATLFVAPAICGIIGGLMMSGAASWALERFGALLAVISGIWFVVGPAFEPLWNAGSLGTLGSIGASGSTAVRALEAIGYHYGTGMTLAVLAAVGLGLLAHVPAPLPATPQPSQEDSATSPASAIGRPATA